MSVILSLILFANNPWGQVVPVHIAWFLMWVALSVGLAFLVAHAVWARSRARPEGEAQPVSSELADCVPAKVPRHSLSARLFHWIMAAAMVTLLATAFLPRAGLRFAWVEGHWIAGLVLVLAILFHIVNALLFMDFWSVWPDRTDLANAKKSLARGFGKPGPAPGKPGKYPLPNKLYHLAIVVCALCMAATGLIMMWRVRTPFFPRDPYLLSDTAWGAVYLMHGFAGVTLITLVIIHVYFALRPDERPVLKGMVTGTMDRQHVLEHHDPSRWGCETQTSK